MSNLKWIGGASASAQVTDFTPANVEIGDIFTIIMTAEDGSTTVSIPFTATAATVANVTAGLSTAYNISSNSLADGMTAVDNTTKVTVTADVAGVPFYPTATAVDGGGTDTQTLAVNTTTASSGPHDWAVLNNWEKNGSVGVAIPVNADGVRLTGANDIRYGLDQSGVALASLYIGQDYTGSVGNTTGSFYLSVGATVVNVSGNGAYYFINGTLPSVYVKSTRSGNDRVWLDGDIDNTWISSGNVLGEIKFAASMVLDNVFMTNAPRARATLGASITSLDLIEMDSGKIDNSATVVDVKVAGGEYTQTDGAISTKLETRGTGTVKYNSDGTVADLVVFNGHFDLSDSTADSVTITAAEVISGMITLNSGMSNTIWTADIVNRDGTIKPEAGQTVTP